MSVKQQRRARRPKVAGHNRPRPAVEPDVEPDVEMAVESDAEVVDPPDDEPVSAQEAPRRSSRLPLILVLVAAVLAGAGVFFLVKAQSSEQGVDTKAMTEVNGQVTSALEKIFSFSYDKLDESAAAAREVLAGTAIGEYDKLIEQVKTQAPAQKLVLATKVTTAGVKSLDGDRTELLVFLDQVATRVDTGKTSGSAAALSVAAERQNGVWKITGLMPR
jgi:Mce-associated membrane protein